MKMHKGFAASAAAISLGAGLALAGPASGAQAAPAEAQLAGNVACARTSGNSAGACFAVASGSWRVTLWDNACDGHRSYTEYYVNPANVSGWGTKHRYKPKTKCGKRYTIGVASHSRGYKVKIRACVEDSGPNTCSKWGYGRT
ncbi:hypothetical protein [Streptomyces iconiensis]|uniref:Secreted protein n=1 Tax=Streptomyces iconiensis TaxID=1384038 RepID=A0ABT7A7D4_9ACTN|nr:hypothetical protein [Streptomyces iconiensis]MDJ1137234.1 hypothetical protein [Streptomyces iconiensis]